MIKQMTRKHSNFLMYLIAVAAFAYLVFSLFNINSRTEDIASNTKGTAERIESALTQHQLDTEADHDGQDKLLQCIVNLFVEKEAITKVDVDNCVITTQVPPPKTDEDTAPLSQTNGLPQSPVPSNQGNSSPQSTTPETPSQPENPQDPGLIPDDVPIIGPLL